MEKPSDYGGMDAMRLMDHILLVAVMVGVVFGLAFFAVDQAVGYSVKVAAVRAELSECRLAHATNLELLKAARKRTGL